MKKIIAIWVSSILLSSVAYGSDHDSHDDNDGAKNKKSYITIGAGYSNSSLMSKLSETIKESDSTKSITVGSSIGGAFDMNYGYYIIPKLSIGVNLSSEVHLLPIEIKGTNDNMVGAGIGKLFGFASFNIFNRDSLTISILGGAGNVSIIPMVIINGKDIYEGVDKSKFVTNNIGGMLGAIAGYDISNSFGIDAYYTFNYLGTAEAKSFGSSIDNSTEDFSLNSNNIGLRLRWNF